MTRRLWFVFTFLALAVFAIVVTPWSSVRNFAARRNYPYVVLVSIDTLHIGHTGPYNADIRGTPTLDRFASNGVVFEHAYTQVPITLPSHAALLSGMSPVGHGVMANGDVVPSTVTTLAEVFSEAGYQTAAFISLGVLSRAFGLDQGFDFYDDPFQTGLGRWYRSADEVFDSARQWLVRSHQEPFFLWVHFSDPHEPYVPPAAPPDTRLALDGRILGEWNLASKNLATFPASLPPGRHVVSWTSLRKEQPDDRPETCIRLHLYGREVLGDYTDAPLPETERGVDLRPTWSVELVNREARPVDIELMFKGELIRPAPSDVLDNYQKEVELVDRYLGELRSLAEALQIEEKVLWVIVSDHGEGLFHHDCLGHAEYVFEDQLRVLWLVSGPGVPRGKVVGDTGVLMVDVAPTLLDLIGLAAPTAMDGRSLVRRWDRASPSDRPVREEWWAFALRHETNRLTAIAGYHWPYKWLWRRGLGRQAHDVHEDPWEEKNLLEVPGPERHDELKRLAEQFRQQRQELARQLRHPRRMMKNEESLDLLRSLGYLGKQ